MKAELRGGDTGQRTPLGPQWPASTGPEPKQRHMDKQREMRLCACKAHAAKMAGQASGQAGVTFPPKSGVETRGGGVKALGLAPWLIDTQSATRHRLSR